MVARGARPPHSTRVVILAFALPLWNGLGSTFTLSALTWGMTMRIFILNTEIEITTRHRRTDRRNRRMRDDPRYAPRHHLPHPALYPNPLDRRRNRRNSEIWSARVALAGGAVVAVVAILATLWG